MAQSLGPFSPVHPQRGQSPPEPVIGKPPRPTAGAAVSMILPFQSDMGHKRSWQLGGPQLQNRSSVWGQNKREWGDKRGRTEVERKTSFLNRQPPDFFSVEE